VTVLTTHVPRIELAVAELFDELAEEMAQGE
jgi:hypothetical protein